MSVDTDEMDQDLPIKFTRIETLHRGLAAKVYRGLHKSKAYIVKKYTPLYINELRHERAILKSIQHKNIVSLCPLQMENALVLEAHGCDLNEYLARHVVPDHSAISFLEQIIEGINFIHKKGIVHCDIKPKNILIQRGIIKITDFASAVYVGARNTDMQCTHNYTALEVLLGIDTIEFASDIWSIGCVFYEILTNKQLFSGSGALPIISRILQILGSPQEDDYLGIKIQHLGFIAIFKNRPSTGPLLLDCRANLILDGLLKFDPRKRTTILPPLDGLEGEPDPAYMPGDLVDCYSSIDSLGIGNGDEP